MTLSATAGLVAAAVELAAAADGLRFAPPVAVVYNPLRYAWDLHAAYISRWAPTRPGAVVFVGMNPGPWGMVQTGVPFGEVAVVRDWLGLHRPVGQPTAPHPARPVTGLACQRSEVSGRRLWGLFRARFETPERFFAGHFVVNYCPLAFLEASGRNLTPDRLPAGERATLYRPCDRHLARLADTLQPGRVIGVGRFATDRARLALAGRNIPVDSLPHPSPASPAANRDWAGMASRRLVELGVWPAP